MRSTLTIPVVAVDPGGTIAFPVPVREVTNSDRKFSVIQHWRSLAATWDAQAALEEAHGRDGAAAESRGRAAYWRDQARRAGWRPEFDLAEGGPKR